MNGMERIYAALNFEPVDMVPFIPPFQGYWALAAMGVTVPESITDPAKAAKAQVDISRQCHFDAVEVMWDWMSPVEALGCEVRMQDVGEIATWKHRIAGPSTLEKIEYPSPEKDYRFVAGMESRKLICKKMMEGTLCYGSLCSPFTLAGEIRGVEALILDTIIEPHFARDTIDFCTDVIMDYCDGMLAGGLSNIMLCDPTSSGSLITKADFLKYAHPRMKAIVQKILKEGGESLVHICGDTTDRLEDIATMGMSGFSMDASVNLNYARKVMNGKVAIIGNVHPYRTLFMGTKEDIAAEARKCIRKGGNEGFILAASCDILPSTPVEHVQILDDCRR